MDRDDDPWLRGEVVDQNKGCRPNKHAWDMAWFYFSCVMLPCILFPGNLGPIAIVIGLILFGLPALGAGFVLGKLFSPPSLLNRFILYGVGVGLMVYMFDYVR